LQRHYLVGLIQKRECRCFVQFIVHGHGQTDESQQQHQGCEPKRCFLREQVQKAGYENVQHLGKQTANDAKSKEKFLCLSILGCPFRLFRYN
jgi:hypothetical protein